MVVKKLLILSGLLSALVVTAGCSEAQPVVATPAPVKQEAAAPAPEVATVPAGMTVFTGDTYTLAYPSDWELKYDSRGWDEFSAKNTLRLPSFSVGTAPEVSDRGMCLNEFKKETVTNPSGLTFNLTYYTPETSDLACEDAFKGIIGDGANFVTVFVDAVTYPENKNIGFTYARGTDTSSVAQLKAILSTLKKK